MSLVLSCLSRGSEAYSLLSRIAGKQPFKPQGALKIDPRQYWARRYLSMRFLRGEGIEIGALHQPLALYGGARARYVDRMPVAELRKHYRELDTFDLVEPDYIDNGETLASIPDGSQDFLVANHFIEHCKNPIHTIETHLSKVKEGGMLFYAVPNRDYTFDKDRPLTEVQHILNDYQAPALPDQRAHYEEWVRYVVKPGGEDAIRKETDRLIAEDYSIHFHVWNGASFRQFLETLIQQLSFPFIIRATNFWRYNPFENLFILQRR